MVTSRSDVHLERTSALVFFGPWMKGDGEMDSGKEGPPGLSWT